jgi:hypothetical protein
LPFSINFGFNCEYQKVVRAFYTSESENFLEYFLPAIPCFRCVRFKNEGLSLLFLLCVHVHICVCSCICGVGDGTQGLGCASECSTIVLYSQPLPSFLMGGKQQEI